MKKGVFTVIKQVFVNISNWRCQSK